MLRRFLDLQDARNVELRLRADLVNGLLRDHAKLSLGFACKNLDLQPDAILVLV